MDRAALARASVSEAAESQILAAVWLTVAERQEEAEDFFKRASEQDAGAVQVVKKALGLL